MSIEGELWRSREQVEDLKRILSLVKEALVDQLEVLDVGDCFTAKQVAAQMLRKIQRVLASQAASKKIPKTVDELIKLQLGSFTALSKLVHQLLAALEARDIEIAERIAQEIRALLREESFLDLSDY